MMEGELLRVWFGRTSLPFQAWNSSAETFKLSSPSRRSAGPQTSQTKAVDLNIAPEKNRKFRLQIFSFTLFQKPSNSLFFFFFTSGVKKSKFTCQDF